MRSAFLWEDLNISKISDHRSTALVRLSHQIRYESAPKVAKLVITDIILVGGIRRYGL